MAGPVATAHGPWRLDVDELAPLVVELDESAHRGVLRAGDIVIQWGATLQTEVKREADRLFGRPGVTAGGHRLTAPHTKNYVRSITRRSTRFAGGASTVVGTNAPQGRRLEHGFYGMTDRLGRTFYQPPYPHWRPTFERVKPRFRAALIRDLSPIR